ncbi:TetR/AcrR family transcriptional regulator [Streptomyces sp. 8L]|uniref:TetR/AcrR family transcriptional regulator n=1 Tax=unclassified Streptomyces TaxID=2593676 RepID=UPI001CD79E48|nr:TetR/AcrR family transcriptional regulator [Streptomyces sp. 8L]MCA1219458.1 TetR/AcrR family transcriptional regulator [Streptomyces sp. 8L]
MSRLQTFDEAQAVDHAMEVFWTKGYDRTSLDDLTSELGIAPGRLRQAFGDKHGLFLRALARYRDSQARSLAPALLSEGLVLPRIRAIMLGYLQLAAEESEPRGCLIANTAGEVLPGDPAVADCLAEVISVVEDGFLQGLEHAVRQNELPEGLDLAANAAMLTMVLQGLQVLVKLDPDPLRLTPAVDAALAGLNALSRTGTLRSV